MPDDFQLVRPALIRLRQAAHSAGETGDRLTLRKKRVETLAKIRAVPAFANIDGLEGDLDGFIDPVRPFESDPVELFLNHLREMSAQVRTATIMHYLLHLKIPSAFTVDAVTFHTTDRWPQTPGPDASERPAASVEVTGTDPGEMALRARKRTEDALRKLRITAAGRMGIKQMLRFGLAGSWAFEDGTNSGFWLRDDAPVALDLADMAEWLQTAPQAARIPVDGRSQAQEQAWFAVLWLDKASLATDLLDRTLFAINALEAILGNKSAGLKAEWLIYHRILLGAKVSGWWTSPKPLYAFYDKVRSFAVHGSIPEVELVESDIDFLIADVRMALDDYLSLCASGGHTRRSKLLKDLRNSPEAPEVLAFLREHDPEVWSGWTPPGE